MRVLITGAKGFVGKNLAERLVSFHQVLAVGRQELDLLDETAVSDFIFRNKPEAIIHTATTGGHGKSVKNVFEQELRMFFNIERCINENTLLVNCGSGAEYDRRFWRPKMTEEYFDQHVPADEYGYAKYLIAKAIEASPKRVVSLRIFGLFGKYENCYYKFISNAILKNLFGIPLTIQRNTRFDYLFIDDFCDIVMKVLAKNPHQKQYNVTPDSSIELSDICERISCLTGLKSVFRIRNTDFAREYSGDNSLIRSEYSFKISDFDESLRALIDYYSSIIHTVDVNKLREDDYLAKMTKITMGLEVKDI